MSYIIKRIDNGKYLQGFKSNIIIWGKNPKLAKTYPLSLEIGFITDSINRSFKDINAQVVEKYTEEQNIGVSI